MELNDAVDRLTALAHGGRLSIIRRLVRAGPEGVAAGTLANDLEVAPNTLSAQLNQLTTAGLINRQRDGRSILYRANFDALAGLIVFLMEDCCAGRTEIVTPIEQSALCCRRSANCSPSPTEEGVLS